MVAPSRLVSPCSLFLINLPPLQVYLPPAGRLRVLLMYPSPARVESKGAISAEIDCSVASILHGNDRGSWRLAMPSSHYVPEHKGLHASPGGAEHPNHYLLCLATWTLSGDDIPICIEFWHKPQARSVLPIDHRCKVCITSSGSSLQFRQAISDITYLFNIDIT